MSLDTCVKSIRHILRKDGITGMDSICHCISFIILRSLTVTKCNRLEIPIKYAFENIDKDDDNNLLDQDLLFDKVFSNKKGVNSFIRQLRMNIKYTTFKWKLRSPDKLNDIINLLKDLDYENISIKKDIIGTIYELHLKTGSSGSGMRDLGQYFTHRLVIKYMVELCNPKMIGTHTEKIVDPSMGTGGFLTMAAKYYNEKYPSIDWTLNKKRISGFDIDESVMEMAKLNLFLETDEHFNTLVQRDTLYKDMVLSNNSEPLTADIILANEPMGLTNLVHANCCDRIKDLKIRGTSAEPLFLQLFMEALNKNGRCAVVIPDGVLFNESNLHQGTRKKLIEDFNLEKVITLNDKKFFTNTGVKTSILYFVNNGKTTKTTFSSISLENDEIKEDVIMDVEYDTLVQKKYSLFINKYKVSLENRIDGIEYKKLGDICEFLPKSKRPASFGKNEGEFEFFTSSMKIKRCDIADYNQKSLIIGDGGVANINYSSNFNCSDHNYVLTCNDKNINIKYLYFYLRFNINIIELGFKGSTLKNLSKNFVKDLEIPIPSLEVQNAIVERLDIINENNATCQKQIDEFKKIMKFYIETNTLFGEEKRLGDICEIKSGNHSTAKKDFKKSGYPIIGGGKKSIGFFDKYNCEENTILCASHGSAGYISMYNEKTFLTVCFAFNIMSDSINKYYLYRYLKLNESKISDLSNKTAQPCISMKNLKEFKIKVVSLEEQQKIIDYCDNLQNIIKKLEGNIANNNTLMKTILKNKLKQQSIDTPVETPIVTHETVESVTSEQSLEEFTVKLNKLSNTQLNEVLKNNNLRGKTKNKPIKKQMIIDTRSSKHIVL